MANQPDLALPDPSSVPWSPKAPPAVLRWDAEALKELQARGLVLETTRLVPSTMLTVRMEVTPTQAKAWLARMPAQRRLRKNRIVQLSRALRDGKWVLLPNGIAITADGDVIDGQHRLQLIVDTDLPAELTVTFGVPDEVRDFIDAASSPRDVADTLRMCGVPSGLCPVIAAGLRVHYRDETGSALFDPSVMPNNYEALQLYFEAADDWLLAADLARRAKQIPQRYTLLGYYLFRGLGIDRESTIGFARALPTGHSQAPGSPVLLYRNAFTAQRARHIKLSPNDEALMIVTALNHWYANARLDSWRGIALGDKMRPPPLGEHPSGRLRRYHPPALDDSDERGDAFTAPAAFAA